MGKYIVELKKNETLYKAATRESDGTAYVCSAIGTPYTAPDLEQIRKEAYQQGYEQGYKDGYNEPGKGKIQVGDEVKPKIGEMLREINDMESRCEKAQEEAHANGWNAGSKATREETWDLAKRIVCSEANGGLSGEELHDIFGWRTPSLILLKFTAEEAAEKIHEWEMREAEAEDRHEFEKGDEVIAVFGKAVVTKVNAENVEYIYGNGMSGKDKKTNVKWTGKNYCAMGRIMDKLLEE